MKGSFQSPHVQVHFIKGDETYSVWVEFFCIIVAPKRVALDTQQWPTNLPCQVEFGMRIESKTEGWTNTLPIFRTVEEGRKSGLSLLLMYPATATEWMTGQERAKCFIKYEIGHSGRGKRMGTPTKNCHPHKRPFSPFWVTMKNWADND